MSDRKYGVDNYKPGTYDQFPIKSYNYVNLDAGYQLPVFKKRLSFDVQVFNLFDDESITQFASSAKSGEALFWTQAGRSIFFSVSARL